MSKDNPQIRREPWHLTKSLTTMNWISLGAAVVVGAMGWQALSDRVFAAEKEQSKTVEAVKENKKDLQTVKTDVAVIKDRQERAMKIQEMILREVRK